MCSGRVAVLAQACEFDHLPLRMEAMLAGDIGQIGTKGRGCGFLDEFAGQANQENDPLIPVMLMMNAGNEGVQQLQAMDQPVLPQEIERSVNGDWCKRAATFGTQGFDQIIGATGAPGLGKRFKHRTTLRGEAQTVLLAKRLGCLHGCRSIAGVNMTAIGAMDMPDRGGIVMLVMLDAHAGAITSLRPYGEIADEDIALQKIWILHRKTSMSTQSAMNEEELS